MAPTDCACMGGGGLPCYIATIAGVETTVHRYVSQPPNRVAWTMPSNDRGFQTDTTTFEDQPEKIDRPYIEWDETKPGGPCRD